MNEEGTKVLVGHQQLGIGSFLKPPSSEQERQQQQQQQQQTAQANELQQLSRSSYLGSCSVCIFCALLNNTFECKGSLPSFYTQEQHGASRCSS
eukprot:1157313-Pelagomonas_calceolata.AAC.3